MRASKLSFVLFAILLSSSFKATALPATSDEVALEARRAESAAVVGLSDALVSTDLETRQIGHCDLACQAAQQRSANRAAKKQKKNRNRPPRPGRPRPTPTRTTRPRPSRAMTTITRTITAGSGVTVYTVTRPITFVGSTVTATATATATETTTAEGQVVTTTTTTTVEGGVVTQTTTVTDAPEATATVTATATTTATATATATVTESTTVTESATTTTTTTTTATVTTNPPGFTTGQATFTRTDGPTPTGTPPDAQLGALARQAIIDAHNVKRAEHAVPPLTWNTQVEAYAIQEASKCMFAHSSGVYGENLALGSPSLSVVEAVQLWYDEIRFYNFRDPGFRPESGHFTQVVWRTTTELGCAKVRCPMSQLLDDPAATGEGDLVWCNYSPPGNILDQFAVNVPPPIDA